MNFHLCLYAYSVKIKEVKQEMLSDIGIIILMSAIIVCGIAFPALVIVPVVIKSLKEAREEKEYQENKKTRNK